MARPSKIGIRYDLVISDQFFGVNSCPKIIRHGLWFKTIANGRAHGHGNDYKLYERSWLINGNTGVYLAKEGSVSTGGYAGAGQTWSKSMIAPQNCVALVEVVNRPHKFVSQNPYFVVNQTHWILW